jgi:hypothetical protein
VSTKRFCDLCNREIAVDERWYDVILNVQLDSHGADPIDTLYREFCYGCVRHGSALVNLMDRYEKKRATPSLTVNAVDPSAQLPGTPTTRGPGVDVSSSLETVSWGDTREKS